MFKLLGFLLGSAVSIFAIVMLLGMPEFHLSRMTDEHGRFDAAVEQLKEKQQLADLQDAGAIAVDEPVATEEFIPAEAADEVQPDDSSTVTNDATVEMNLPETEVADSAVADEPFNPLDMMPEPIIEGEASWYAFWNPFRSEIAARGFVAQLEKVTGLDYRIIKVKAGVYQVAFAYADDQERQARLSQIQAATGLDLSGT